YILALVVIGAPLAGFSIEDGGAFLFTGNNKEAIFTCFKCFALYLNVFVRFKNSGFVGSGTPYFSIGYEIPPNGSPFDSGTTVADFYLGTVYGSFGGPRRTGFFLGVAHQRYEHQAKR